MLLLCSLLPKHGSYSAFLPKCTIVAARATLRGVDPARVLHCGQQCRQRAAITPACTAHYPAPQHDH